MASRGRPPRGAKPGASWLHDRCPVGHVGCGWIAGDVHGVIMHPSKSSKPCRREYCGENAVCEFCDRLNVPEWLGYVPLYRHDGRGVVVIIREHQRESVSALPLHCNVTWSRAAGRGESVAIAPREKQVSWFSTLPEKRVPASLALWLPKLWRMPDMAAMCLQEFGSHEAGVTAPLEVEPYTGPQSTGMVPPPPLIDHALRRRLGQMAGKSEPASVGDVLDDIARNGKPRKG